MVAVEKDKYSSLNAGMQTTLKYFMDVLPSVQAQEDEQHLYTSRTSHATGDSQHGTSVQYVHGAGRGEGNQEIRTGCCEQGPSFALAPFL